MDAGRPSGEFGGQIAQDVDLAESTQWWTAAQPLPPSLQNRNGVDILSESEESQKSRRGGRTAISKDIYVLFMDYSQTVITAQYDSREPSDVSLEQRHEPPPPKLRQDQLESYWQKFGRSIAEKASAAGNSKKDQIIGDGTPASLPLELIKQHTDALLPVGTRAYGALVYANLANASTQQFDEIRPGDIITVRNAKFEGHHGAMKTRYKVDYGPWHVGVVEEWDGTRRSVRAWEQGREKKGGVRSEKFRLGDLRSGEVRVWRVVGREWVGWES
jgi:myosin tail region-interacting protein MTI1